MLFLAIPLAVLLTGLLAAACWIVGRLLYPPRQALESTPAGCGLDYEDVRFTSDDGLELHGWWVPAAGEPGDRPAVILLHPLAGSREGFRPRPGAWAGVSHAAVDLLAAAARFHQAGFHVLLFDFRGHGQSPPGCCAGGLNEDRDVAAAVDDVFRRLDCGEGCAAPRVGVVGFGLGANAAIAAIGREKGSGEAIRIFSADSESAAGWTEFPPVNVKRLRFLAAVQPGSLHARLRWALRRRLPGLGAVVLPAAGWLYQQRCGYPLGGALLLKLGRDVNVPALFAGSRADEAGELQALYAAGVGEKELWWIDAGPLEAEAYACAHLERVVAFAVEKTG
jgi:pimeloyl-ACP methyl ester carboxylesterase